MAKKVDPAVVAHQEWIGFLQPVGLVVSPHALVRAGAILDRRDAEGQRLLRACTEEREFHTKEGPVPWLPDFQHFASSVLNWSFSPKGYAGTSDNPIPPELEIVLPEYEETLRPDFAVRELEPQDGASSWQLLVRVLEPGDEFDRVVRGNGQLEASAHGRMERLLRRTGLPAGLLFNGLTLRLLSAPRGESSGWLNFQVADMVQTAGRPISTALRLLLREPRLLSLPRQQRLSALLEDSRRFQNEVSERLAEQVLHALYEFLRGFQSAHDASGGELLREPLTEHPDEVYHALLTVILRLVFLIYTEERNMLPDEETFLRHYSLAGLYERLREDAALFPDTMDQRYGAWAQLLVLFRLIHDGAESGAMHLPQRHGVLFDPDRFKFLEGRPTVGARQTHERIEPPLVPDGTIYRALDKLLVLDGERISYRALDVEQIGSVYETMMGFRLETATGSSVAIKATKKHGAPTTVDLEALVDETNSKRRKWMQHRTDRKLTDRVFKAVRDSTNLADLHAALDPVLDKDATPDLVPKGAMVLQPSEERRKSGSHYTPRELTGPIVRTTLEPILKRLLGEDDRPPSPDDILDLKVCDPAMGSGAFLVEACRQLGDALIETWHFHDQVPEIPADDDELVFARRLIAQRCLYGVDKNPVAVDLSKMSLWLVTLAKDHPLTFVDHSLRHGDSLIGLSRRQIEALHWNESADPILRGMGVRETLDKVAELRKQIREADETMADWKLRDLWEQAQFELGKVRLFGDLVVAAYFEGKTGREQEAKRNEYATAIVSGEAGGYSDMLEEWRHAEQPLVPFHWEIEFPECFSRETSGFTAIVGNPPFLAGTRIKPTYGESYRQWLIEQIGRGVRGLRGAADYCVYFFLAAFSRLVQGGNFGLIATNSIAQGDSRVVGLKRLIEDGATIYSAIRSMPWPGSAATHVAVVWIAKEHPTKGPITLDGNPVSFIGDGLSESSANASEPAALNQNKEIAFEGAKIAGIGFVISGDEAKAILDTDDCYRDVVKPYLSGKDLNSDPLHRASRWAVNFEDRPLAGNAVPGSPESAADYPLALEIVRERVMPQRLALKPNTAWNRGLQKRWWQYGLWRPALSKALEGKTRVLVTSRVSLYRSFAFVDTTSIFSDSLVVVAKDDWEIFAILSSRVHETWAHRPGSTTLEDRSNYLPTRAFATFPFPENMRKQETLGRAGEQLSNFRSNLMSHQNDGLTETYNRFHDPEERAPAILRLRELHSAMDRVALDSYGWTHIPTDSEFLLDYEIDEENWSPRKKKPWRYRWPNEIRDEVLARLLELNAERAKEEARAGATRKAAKRTKKAQKKANAKASDGDTDDSPQNRDLFS